MPVEVHQNSHGIIEIVLKDKISAEDVKYIVDVAMPIVTELEDNGQPVLVLCNLSKVRTYTAESQSFAKEIVNTIPYDKIADYGAPNRFVEFIFDVIIKGYGQGPKIQQFKTRKQALDWLMQSQDPAR